MANITWTPNYRYIVGAWSDGGGSDSSGEVDVSHLTVTNPINAEVPLCGRFRSAEGAHAPWLDFFASIKPLSKLRVSFGGARTEAIKDGWGEFFAQDRLLIWMDMYCQRGTLMFMRYPVEIICDRMEQPQAWTTDQIIPAFMTHQTTAMRAIVSGSTVAQPGQAPSGPIATGSVEVVPSFSRTRIFDPENDINITQCKVDGLPTDQVTFVLTCPPNVKLKKMVIINGNRIEVGQPLGQPHRGKSEMTLPLSGVIGHTMELWLTGFMFIDYLKYPIAITNPEALGGRSVHVDWINDTPDEHRL
jgi:hypothetical protein